MKRRDSCHRRFRSVVLAIGLVAALSGAALAQGTGRVFGFGDYPGGTLHTVFEMVRGADAPTRTYTIDVVPEDDHYNMIETISSPLLQIGQIDSGLGRSGAAGTAGANYNVDRERANIDLSPLYTLDERNVLVEADQNYYLPDGARLVTEGVEKIAGIDVIMGTFVHPGYPGQVVRIGFADPEIEKLLLFPVYMRRDVDGELDYLVQLIEFTHEP